ncbi:MAG: cytochrome c [Chloroflexi bacterium]|nr:cytochrome c [Chloroflexota bacterium]
MNGTIEPVERPMRNIVRSRKAWVLAVALASAFVLAGCSGGGAYPADFFSEMHYNQSYKVQEPPSLSAPSDSVPITGREVSYTLAEARQLTSPVAGDAAAAKRGEALFRVNCSVCHGARALGDGPMADRLTLAGYSGKPANLTMSGPIGTKSDGEVFQVITKGYLAAYEFPVPAGTFVMPAFGKVLSEKSRWEIIAYLRTLN